MSCDSVADSNLHMQTTMFWLDRFCSAFVFFLLAFPKTLSSAPGIPNYVAYWLLWIDLCCLIIYVSSYRLVQGRQCWLMWHSGDSLCHSFTVISSGLPWYVSIPWCVQLFILLEVNTNKPLSTIQLPGIAISFRLPCLFAVMYCQLYWVIRAIVQTDYIHVLNLIVFMVLPSLSPAMV
jgi:hypothetical protein